MILGSLVEVLNEENNRYETILEKKKKKFSELDYYDRRQASRAWLHDRIDDVADYAKEKPGEYAGTVIGTGLGAMVGGLPGAAIGGVAGNLGVKAIKKVGKLLDDDKHHYHK